MVEKYENFQLKKIINDISNLSDDEKKEVFKILDNHNIKYTENSNGIYVLFSQVPDQIIDEIEKFLNFCAKNKVALSQVEDKQNTEKQNFLGESDEDEEIIDYQTPTDNKYTAKITHQNELDKYGLNLDKEEDVNVNLTKNKPKYSGIKAKIIKSSGKTKSVTSSSPQTDSDM